MELTIEPSNESNPYFATDNFIIFSISGGAGKNILATAVVKAIKAQHPEMNIVVLTAWKDVWMYNPNVYRSYNFQNSPYFYDNYIKGKKNVKVFSLDPYQTEQYILKKEHLIYTWCNLYGIQYNGEQPELFFNKREVEFVQNTYVRNEPIFLIQTNGGADANNKYSWMRDIPIGVAQQVAEQFRGEVRLMHIRRDEQLPMKDIEQFKGNLRELFVLIRESKYRLFNDSVSQHASNALGKKATFWWVKNDPQVLGYSLHDNIVTDAVGELNSLDFSLLEPYDISGQIAQCPFKEGTELFSVEEIVNSVRSQA
jgi:kynurenine formamidase